MMHHQKGQKKSVKQSMAIRHSRVGKQIEQTSKEKKNIPESEDQ